MIIAALAVAAALPLPIAQSRRYRHLVTPRRFGSESGLSSVQTGFFSQQLDHFTADTRTNAP